MDDKLCGTDDNVEQVIIWTRRQGGTDVVSEWLTHGVTTDGIV